MSDCAGSKFGFMITKNVQHTNYSQEQSPSDCAGKCNEYEACTYWSFDGEYHVWHKELVFSHGKKYICVPMVWGIILLS